MALATFMRRRRQPIDASQRAAIALVALLAFGAAPASSAELPASPVLPDPSPHWVWVSDRVFKNSLLFDADSGEVLGSLDGGRAIAPKPPLSSRSRGEIVSIDTFYTRGTRGERLDFATIYDAKTLAVKGEVPLPHPSGDSGTAAALTGILDGGRFVAVFSQFPLSVISIVDLDGPRYAGHVVTTGCYGVYPVAARRFATLCGDGTAMLIELDDAGGLARQTSSAPFFDAVDDPVFASAARDGSRWLFGSFGGRIHEVDFSGSEPSIAEPWSLVDDGERAAGWRPGGAQKFAFHRGSRRLYAVMHEGEPGSHKQAGNEIWVFDTDRRQRLDRITAPNTLISFIRPQIGLESGSWSEWLLGLAMPNQGVHSIAVTQDEAPLLFARFADFGSVAVLDALSGEHLRDLEQAGLSGVTLAVP